MVSYALNLESITIISVVFLLLGVAVFYLGDFYYRIKRETPELKVFMEARKPPRHPIIRMTDKTGRETYFLGVKDKPNDVTLKHDHYFLLDPAVASKMPKSTLEDGTRVIDFVIDFPFPVDRNGAKALIQVINNIRKEYPFLNVISDDTVLIELLTKKGDRLEQDCATILKQFKPKKSNQNVTSKVIADTIEKIKSDLKDWSFESGSFSLAEVIERLPFGMMTVMMRQATEIMRLKTLNEKRDEDKNWQFILGMVGFFTTVMVVAYLVVSNVKP